MKANQTLVKAHQIASLIVTVLALLMVLWALGSSPFRLVRLLMPRMVLAPADLRIGVTVEPVADNRHLRLEGDSGQTWRASEVELNGLAGPRTSWFYWRDLDAGHYVVTASVRDANHRLLAQARELLLIAGREQFNHP